MERGDSSVTKRASMRVSSGSPYEPGIGFSRAAREGAIIAVAGTAPIAADGTTACPGDPAGQARRCLEIIRDALHAAGADLRHVIRTRMYLRRIEDWAAVGQVHGEFFGDIRPASTVVQVSAFVDPDWLVEIEADAVAPWSGPPGPDTAVADDRSPPPDPPA